MLFVFGESEKGPLCRPTFCKDPLDLFTYFGHQVSGTCGFDLAAQSLLLKRPCVFFRIREEGFSDLDYLRGLHILKSDWKTINISAIGVPGLGNPDLLDEIERLCKQRRSIILIEEKDLCDFLS